MSWLTNVDWPGWRGVVEIAIMSGMLYFIFLMFRGTRSMQVFTGLIVLVIAFLGLTQLFHLTALNWLLRQFFLYAAVGVLIIFQPEIRSALAEIGRKPVFHSTSETRGVVDCVVTAVAQLSQQHIGALIAIERDVGTRAIQDTGIRLDSLVNPEVLVNIFYPNTPLHDGGVILCGNRIAAAACLFPLSQNMDLTRGMGTRHRAAIGLTEETDAITVVVSEETGAISISHQGSLTRDLDEDNLRRFLLSILVREAETESHWRYVLRQISTNLGLGGRTPPIAGKERGGAHGG